MTILNIPLRSEDLIKKLDELFPEKTPDISWSDREIWSYAGKRELIRLLKASLEKGDESLDGRTNRGFEE